MMLHASSHAGGAMMHISFGIATGSMGLPFGQGGALVVNLYPHLSWVLCPLVWKGCPSCQLALQVS